MCVRCLCRRTGNPYVCEACMSKKLLLIYNPTSGKAQVKSRLSDIIDVFAGGGYDVTVRPTQGPDDAYNTTCEKAGCFDLLVVCGGDGTLNECVRGLLTLPPGNRKPLGYIPAGSTNDFASTLGIPKTLSRPRKMFWRASRLPVTQAVSTRVILFISRHSARLRTCPTIRRRSLKTSSGTRHTC